ncbi:DNA-directed RNA polymerase, 18 kD subunit [Salmon gill poxvirus]|uniref:DNA-directed RNA polymerase 18 kDa subunit n=1 Tax=Salmon gill poxvirus TaxID=1680908 RepID=A0A0H4Y176_9POXV|nr:DNA-directed RNA polymerase, 18 kD subunit [Salmon gill poxvirus]AKR04260.1 DNA-directed RNA polymerase, 18 kD subunit [Salmon gill poxvirus]WMX26543.1 DNA-directed RNA polymerase 18 kD subunit [Salmon gill poxvirus]
MDKLWEELSKVNKSDKSDIEHFLEQPAVELVKADDFIVDEIGGYKQTRKRGRPKKLSHKSDAALKLADNYRENPVEESDEPLVDPDQKNVKPVYGKNIPIETLIKTNIVNQEGPNSFSCPYVYDIDLKLHELGPDLFATIKNNIATTFLNQEIQGKMLVDFTLDPNIKFYLGNNVDDIVSVRVPIIGKFKIYRIGDIIQGKLKITNQQLVLEGIDILCEIYKENGIITIKNNKNCFTKNAIDYYEDSVVNVKIVNITTTTKSFAFISHGILHENSTASH